MKKTRQNNAFYASILYTSTFTVVITIIVLSTVFYFSFERIVRQQTYDHTMNNLLQTSREVSTMAVTASTFAKQIFNDIHVNKLVNFSNSDVMDTMTVIAQLNSYRATSPFIDSIYVYDGKSGTFYVSSELNDNAVQKVQDFYDGEIVAMLQHLDRYPTLVPIPRRVPVSVKTAYSQEKERDVYSFLLYDTLTAQRDQKVIVVNISETQMHNSIDGLITNSEKNTFIVDAKGRLVSNSWKLPMLTDISHTNYIRRILDSGDQSGYFTDNENGVNAFFSYTEPDALGWRYIQIVPENIMMQQIKSLRWKTAAFALLILFGGCVVSYLLSHRLYRKVNRKLDELNVLESEKRNHSETLRQEVMRNLLFGWKHPSAEEMKESFLRLDIPLHPDRECILLLFKIDRYQQFTAIYSAADRNLLKFGVMNVAEEMLREDYLAYSVDMGEDRIIVTINAKKEVPPVLDEKLTQTLARIRQAVHEWFELSVTVAVSVKADSLEYAHHLYNQAMEASLHRLYYGYGSLIDAGKIEEYKQNVYMYPIHKEKMLVEELRLGKMEESKALVTKILTDTANYSYMSFTLALSHLTLAVNGVISTIEQNGDISLQFNANTLLASMNHAETLEEILARFFQAMDMLASSLEEKKNSKHDELVQQIRELIDTRYMDQDLSLETIADELRMSSTHIGRLYKKITSKTILNYITEVRMAKAGELLVHTGLSVAEIAEKSGFSHSTYFYKAFKKCHGVTPIDYRKHAGSDEGTIRQAGGL